MKLKKLLPLIIIPTSIFTGAAFAEANESSSLAKGLLGFVATHPNLQTKPHLGLQKYTC